MKRFRAVVGQVAVVGTAALLAPRTVEAHIEITGPATRNPALLKAPPCGGATERANVVTFRPGQTITLQWKEYVDHPGYFRVSFDDDGEDFEYPPDQTVPAPDDPPFNDQVLINMLPSIDGYAGTEQAYSADVTLPDITCDNCTLQLLQVMTEMPGKTPSAANPTNHLYFQCMDLVLSEDAPVSDPGTASDPLATPPDDVMGDTGADGEAASGGGAAAGDMPTSATDMAEGVAEPPSQPRMAGGCGMSRTRRVTGALRGGLLIAFFFAVGRSWRRRRKSPLQRREPPRSGQLPKG